MKKCCTCKKYLDFFLFGKNSSKKDGFQDQCKICRKISLSKYEKSSKGKATKNRYKISEKGKISNKRYNCSKKGKIAKIKYFKSKKGIKYLKKKQLKYQKFTNARTAKYRAKKLDATPSWLSVEQLTQIKQFYVNCPKGYEVDHIIPLQGENVCGLHVPWNLQLLSVSQNRSKSNKLKGM
jgi:hypothetical protein